MTQTFQTCWKSTVNDNEMPVLWAEGQKMPQQIFLVYTCDEWNSTDSQRLICATTQADEARDALIEGIDEGAICYDDSLGSVDEMISEFKSDWKKLDRNGINSKLSFGYYTYVYDGERL